MLIRFSSSNLTALCVAYIVLIGAKADIPSDLELSIPRKPHPNNLPEISSKAIRSILIGCMTMGLSMMFLPNFLTLGFCISISGGVISMIAGFGQMVGLWDWAEYRLKKEREEDRIRLEQVMGSLRVGREGSEDVVKMASEKVKEIRLNTAYGIMVTKIKPRREGYIVTLETNREKEETVMADLVWAGKSIKGEEQAWVNTARQVIVGEPWEYLISLYS
jgi:hypothetical protein